MQKTLRLFSALDWVVSSVTLAIGLWTLNVWVIVAGVLGLAVAWYSPARRVSARLQKYLFKKRQAEDHSHVLAREDEFYASLRGEAAGAQEEAQTPGEPSVAPAADFSRSSYVYAQARLNPSRHNVLKPQYFDLTPGTRHSRWT